MLKTVLALLLMLCVAVQTAGAGVLPVCEHHGWRAQTHGVSPSAASAMHHGAVHLAPADHLSDCHGTAPTAPHHDGGSCCHAGCFVALPVFFAMPDISGTYHYVNVIDTSPPSVVLPVLDRPPLTRRI